MRPLPDLYVRRRATMKGYFAYPLLAEDRSVPNYQQWLEFDAILSEAKRGQFARIPQLADSMVAGGDWVLQGERVRLLGDAGRRQYLDTLLRTLPVGKDILLECAYAKTFELWGHLSVIPVLIDMYERYSFSQDARFVAMSLSRLMEKTPDAISGYPLEQNEGDIKEYCQMVRQRYEELCESLSTRDAVVFRGEVISLQHLSKTMIDDLGVKHGFEEEMRHKFEAYTGVDCSSFYVNETLQPLAVAALVEEFLESPEAAKFEKGVRYFFGHRIPD